MTSAGVEQLDWARKVRTAKLAQRLARLGDEDIHRLLDVLPLLEALAADD